MKIVEKAWGVEYWLVNLDHCMKKMAVHAGFQCSKHRHFKKEETFYVLEGHLKVETWSKFGIRSETIIPPGQSITIERKQWHRFSSDHGCWFIECSTHHEDDDCERETKSGPTGETLSEIFKEESPIFTDE